MSENKNVILALVLSMAVLLGWQFFFAAPQMKAEKAGQEQGQEAVGTESPGEAFAPPSEERYVALSREQALQEAPRITIQSARLSGSLSLQGARLDDLSLNDYHETVEPQSPRIIVLTPRNALSAYYAEFGWQVPQGANIKVPDRNTIWKTESEGPLSPGKPALLSWDNGEGLIFRRQISLDEDFLFTIADEVENKSSDGITLYPFALIARHGLPETKSFFILHEGFLSISAETRGDFLLDEVDYEDVEEEGKITKKSEGGWIGITDKYWLTALIPDQATKITSNFRYVSAGNAPIYQADFMGEAQTIASGSTLKTSNRFFAGAKEVKVLGAYTTENKIPRFDDAIDWGWFHFLTKPMFRMLHYIYGIVGNFGIAILILTVFVKAVFFPLANKSYVAMSRMKKLQPEMTKLRERYKDDRAQQQKELMALYQREQVNPLAGCLPILIQIPVFFALYKMLFVTIEMRHAPFYGWIRDLAAPDPTSLFNLFGLLPYDVPSLLLIGVWPILMGITMYLQTAMNPAPADPVQQKVFALMPLFFTFLLASFPAGLVIYWTWNNTLSILQQYVIMRRQGVSVNFRENFSWLGNIPGLKGFFPKPDNTKK